MAEQEGVIKYQLNYQQKALLSSADIVQLNSWRTIMLRLGMLGQSATRYDNYGFGNISQRYRNTKQFIISGSQTGGIIDMNAADYALVSKCVPERNQISAQGLTRPSSEAMTHGQLYQLSDGINFIIHAHCPQIWRQAGALGLPQTRAEVPYGTVAMADEVARLFKLTDVLQQGLFSMAGHEDGVMAFGNSAAQAGQRLVACYATALGRNTAPDYR